MYTSKQVQMWQMPLASEWLDITLDKLIKGATITSENFEEALYKERDIFIESLDKRFEDALGIIKGRLKKKSNKGITIVKTSQMVSYCRELSVPLKETTEALLSRGIICNYSKNGKGYPYRFNK